MPLLLSVHVCCLYLNVSPLGVPCTNQLGSTFSVGLAILWSVAGPQIGLPVISSLQCGFFVGGFLLPCCDSYCFWMYLLLQTGRPSCFGLVSIRASSLNLGYHLLLTELYHGLHLFMMGLNFFLVMYHLGQQAFHFCNMAIKLSNAGFYPVIQLLTSVVMYLVTRDSV